MASNVEPNGGGFKYLRRYLLRGGDARPRRFNPARTQGPGRAGRSHRPPCTIGSHNCKRQAKTRGFRRVRALERTPRSAAIDANEVECVRCKRLRVMRCLLSECNCSLFVGLTHAGRSKTCVELGRETLEEEDHAYYNPILQSRGLKIWRRQKIHRPPGR